MTAPSFPLLVRLERVALVSTRALSVVGLLALMVLAFLTLANGLLRWAINQPIAGVVDVGGLAIAIAVCCCLPVAMMEALQGETDMERRGLAGRCGTGRNGGLDVGIDLMVDGFTGHTNGVHDGDRRAGAVADNDHALHAEQWASAIGFV